MFGKSWLQELIRERRPFFGVRRLVAAFGPMERRMISRRFTRMKSDGKLNDELSAKESAEEHEKLVSASALIRVHPRESAADLNSCTAFACAAPTRPASIFAFE